MKKNKLDRQVWRNNREKITFTLHPDIVGVIRSIATEEDIPMSVVADEALYAGLKKMGRMDQPSWARKATHPNLHKEVSLICTPSTTYAFIISKHTGMTVSQVIDEVLYNGLLEMQELDALGQVP